MELIACKIRGIVQFYNVREIKNKDVIRSFITYIELISTTAVT